MNGRNERERHHKLSIRATRTLTPSLMDREISEPWEDSHKTALRGLRFREGEMTAERIERR